MNIDGACHCGKITWKAVANPDMVAICYCTDCQTFGSSAFQYTARIKRDDFELTSGQLKEHGKLADSGNERYYSFCGDCGSGIHTSNIDGRGLLSVRLGGCHQKDQLPPKLQIWCCSAPAW
ncbi:MAG: GFA family protein, partial [Pseudomonadota bacterium]|nr:GFA family protein [Pseudomonadota bacterium]